MIELKNFEIQGERGFHLRVGELSINGGQFIQITGNNNSGKSLFLQTIAGLYRQYSGELLYNGIAQKPGEYNVLLLDSFQAFLPGKNLKHNLYLPLGKLSKRKSNQLQALLEKTGLDDLKAKIETLSRSEKKALELIRAIIQQPQFILFDDFDTYFDNTSLDNLTGAFDYAAKSGTAIIITTRRKFAGIKNNYIISAGELYQQ